MRKLIMWLILLSPCCTPAQYLNVDLGVGGSHKLEGTGVSLGLSYPICGDVYGTAGLWRDSAGWSPYWGLSYSWIPTQEEKQ